jgi:hypothetical protein
VLRLDSECPTRVVGASVLLSRRGSIVPPPTLSETEGKCVQVMLLNVRSELSGYNFF